MKSVIRIGLTVAGQVNGIEMHRSRLYDRSPICSKHPKPYTVVLIVLATLKPLQKVSLFSLHSARPSLIVLEVAAGGSCCFDIPRNSIELHLPVHTLSPVLQTLIDTPCWMDTVLHPATTVQSSL